MTGSSTSRTAARSRLLALVAACAIAPATTDAAEVSAPAWTLQRSLSALRDRAMQDEEARVLSALLTREVTEAFRVMSDRGWNDPRARAALLAYALSGGDRALVRERLERIGERLDPSVRSATIAYLERSGDAASPLAGAVAAFPETVRPLVHLAIGLLDPTADDAATHLRHAELLAPGTLIEEAALRHRVALGPRAGVLAEDWHRAAVSYLRRFGAARGRTAAIRPVAHGFAVRGAKFEPIDVRQAIDAAPAAMRETLALEIARECVLAGRAALARAALAEVRGSARKRLYAVAIGPLSAAGVPQISVPDPRDRSLLAARRALGEAIRLPPTAGPGAGPDGGDNAFEGVEDALHDARTVLERAGRWM